MAGLEASVHLDCTAEEAFDFLSRSESIARLAPPDLGLNLVQAPERLSLGSRIEVEVHGYGPVQKILYEIADFAAPQRLTQRQTKGPLKRFEHAVELSEENGGLLVIDRIQFEPPGGLLGFLVTEEHVRSSLQSGLEFRHQELKRILER